ncbi:CHAP domain-containing protein [Novosphingobium sp. MMS21-SN21R]|uniref:CHAP domain-containing protein n=1 Tax=Novosphingobium sp. MMS21-SN21R TaxID=2969298 RepID=UPI002888AD70|nr:CHAP domain-containing protein [Novosphingobium sp. MMS21-SN21R]MDT0507203.1 CHAP domain-containing protein [Novosphingobium sp. MMS21-SN21R]
MRDSTQFRTLGDASGESLPYLQCVPYARQISGIRIYGDALTWWDQAEGRYARGHRPKVGAVMSFAPHGRMELGHVAAVSRVIDSRNVLLRHANWSVIEGRRGQIENDVRAVDVSPENDWSQVRVWYAPIGNLGTTAWPVNGFIYPDKSGKSERLTVLSSADMPQKMRAAETPVSRIGADFLRGIRPEAEIKAAPVRRQLTYSASKPAQPRPARLNPALADDPIGRIIASRMK